MRDLIDREAALACFHDWVDRNGDVRTADEIPEYQAIEALPSVEPDRWNRLMMYLADLQLTYSPNWGANGCGDEKLYEFVTGLIEELQRWDREEDADE